MAEKKILIYPDPLLSKKCDPVEEFTTEVDALITDLVDTMKASPGVGLAAPQIGVLKRVVAVDVTPKNPGKGLIVLINPEIVTLDEYKTVREGCLSVPEYTANISRAQKMVLRGVDRKGYKVELESKGFEAVALQHEIDHLDGTLFIDKITNMKRDLFKRKSFSKS